MCIASDLVVELQGRAQAFPDLPESAHRGSAVREEFVVTICMYPYIGKRDFLQQPFWPKRGSVILNHPREQRISHQPMDEDQLDVRVRGIIQRAKSDLTPARFRIIRACGVRSVGKGEISVAMRLSGSNAASVAGSYVSRC